jgi:hypothetical protein
MDDDDLGWSIKKTAEKTSESIWKVKDRLRRGEYEAVKAGRRTIVKPDSVRKVFATFPPAIFRPVRQRKIVPEDKSPAA